MFCYLWLPRFLALEQYSDHYHELLALPVIGQSVWDKAMSRISSVLASCLAEQFVLCVAGETPLMTLNVVLVHTLA